MTNRNLAKRLYDGMAELRTNCPNGTMLSASVLCDYAGKMRFIRWLENQLDKALPEENTTKLKRFAVFNYAAYYPSGGWNDFHASYHTKIAAISEALKLEKDAFYEFADVIDLETGEIIEHKEKPKCRL